MSSSRRMPAQRGVALIVVLLFLMSLTAIAVVAARKALINEGTGRNQLDMAVAREAAESAMRDAERDLYGATPVDASAISCSRAQSSPLPSDFDTACTQGLCNGGDLGYAASSWNDANPTNQAVSEPWWPTGKGGRWNDNTNTKPSRTPVNTSNCSFTGGVPLGTFTGAAAIRGVARQPEYLVEYFKRKNSGGQEADAYRITTRGFGYAVRTQIVLQSIYSPEQ